MSGIFHRCSIRKYEETKVESEKIEKMLRAAMAAPSACNQQPWEFYVVTDREKIQELSLATPYATPAEKAPLVMVPCYRHELKAQEYAQIDMAASVENILLEADELGLGAVWIGIAPLEDRMAEVKRILDIPDTLSAFCLIACGYPAQIREQRDRFDEARIHYVASED